MTEYPWSEYVVVAASDALGVSLTPRHPTDTVDWASRYLKRSDASLYQLRKSKV